MGNISISTTIFLLMLLATFFISYLGRIHSKGSDHEGLAEEKLNKWLVGLSAGASANSGFVVTAAVGLGYNFGMQWVVGPLGWMLGDLIFWRLFPQRMNAVGQRSRATTMSELLSFGLPAKSAMIVSSLCAVLVLFCLSVYLAGQWLAGQKFLYGAYGFGGVGALALFATVILSYTALGGFRGSIYVDTFQAVIRIFGTVVAIVAITMVALRLPGGLYANLNAVSPTFLSLAPVGLGAAAAFAFGYAASALGYGLGAPQVISRYLAGSSPEETQSAWWIYIGFMQFTWISMTLFGVLLRVVMPGLTDPEAGMSTFFDSAVNPVLTGVIIGDVFATIAATSNALLIALGQALAHDVIQRIFPNSRPRLWLCALTIGVVTMAISLFSHSSVATLTIGSLFMLGAAVGPAVMVKVLDWKHDGASLIATVCGGLFAALIWRALGLETVLSETAVGLAVGVLSNWVMTLRPGFKDMSFRNNPVPRRD